ncbi:hypothetical protein QTA58_16765 [Neorhizobium sp. CSC1952]|jgi:hypothetical protein|uniref:Uncharacterized protein n=1 Tax=Xaviernesmea oryzae TaxID=464029 RepID=A0A1X7GVS9_9HYPH|nr:MULTISPECIES: hypothetical protein [Rhizobium/Agrobacterium group]WJR65872.1 hypothetical protein QTA58_16765 [Rhizobium sp. CSC1952]SMF75280.1 hypothetical protein SAMN02982989_4485 [Xaviernesmea oryzae]
MTARKARKTVTSAETDHIVRPISRAAVVMEDARRAGLLDGEATEHLSVRLPKALVDAAKLEAGTDKPTELVRIALAMLAKPDPSVKFLFENYGRLGKDHTLDY